MPIRNSPVKLPNQYEFIELLVEGSFGKVLKCRHKVTKNIVAVKVNKYDQGDEKEITMLNNLMSHNFDQCNIVKFFGAVPVESHGKALVFEMLDISIFDYMVKNQFNPMHLSDIRSIIQQMATALDALKSIGVIHTDIKTDNIMLVDHRRRPLVAKLIDFGLALPREEATLGKKLSVVAFRSPEIILGLPISEATDMWSLACVMAAMLTGETLFPVRNEYEAIRLIVDFLGQPADHLLDKGLKTSKYFTRTWYNRWRLKTPEEYDETHMNPYRIFKLSHNSLGDLKMYLDWTNKAPAEEHEQCIKLLRAMLTLDATERITPSEVLAHPFIDNEVFHGGPPSMTLKIHDTTNIQPGQHDPSTNTLSVAVMVHPTTAKNTQTLGDQESADSLQAWQKKMNRMLLMASEGEEVDCEPPASALKIYDPTNIQPGQHDPFPTIPPSVAVMVRPTTAKNTQTLGDQESADSLQAWQKKMNRMLLMASEGEEVDCEPPASALKIYDPTNIQPGQHDPFPTIPPSVAVMVRPTTAENTQTMEDQESADSLQAWKKKMNRMLLMASEGEEVDCEPPASALKIYDPTNIQPGQHDPFPTIPPSVAVMVRPTTAENTQTMEDQESADSLQAWKKKMNRMLLMASEGEEVDCEPPASALKDDDTTDIQPDHCSSSPTIPKAVVISVQPATAENTQTMADQESAESEERRVKTKKKKRFRRFCSWMKKTFCCCWTCPNED